MKNFYKKSMKVWRNLNLVEVSFYKIYLISVSIIIAMLFPIVLAQGILFYLITFIILDILSLIILFNREWNFLKKVFKKKKYKVFRKYWTFDFAIFKITLIFFWLLLVKLLPVLLTINIWIYTFIVWVWIWYYVSKLLKK